MSRTGILDGVRVLDLTRVVAGPMATQILADLGATVLKIEKPGSGDDTRRMGPFVTDAEGAHASATYAAYNRGKRSLAIDIAQPAGAQLVQRLAGQCDIVIENFKVGTLARFGLDAATLTRSHPGLIYCSVTGFGQDGPYAPRPAYDFIIQGMSGLMSTCGDAAGPPMRTSIPLTDLATGLYTTVALLGALLHRRTTGEGQVIDMALLDAAVAFNGHLAQGYLMGAPVPHRAGNTNPIASPSEVFACADGPLIVAAGNDAQFVALCDVLGLSELARDPRFSTNAERIRRRDELRAALAPALAGFTRADLAARLDAANVPGGPIHDMAGVFNDAQVRHRGLAASAGASDAAVPTVRSPLRFSRTPVQHGPVPGLGEGTQAVLREWLQMSDDDFAGLRRAGVVA